MIFRKLSICGIVAVFAGQCFAQKLTMDDAIRLAKQNNGTLKAAMEDLVASKARKTQANSSFLPTLTPSVTYTNSLREIPSASFGNTTSSYDQTTTQAALSWRVLDAGQRLASLRAARESVSAQTASTEETLRQIIFNVVSQFLETLRAQELEKVSDAQLARANKVLDQTKARVTLGDAAQREILQAEADALNAKVNSITSRNRTSTNAATLKSIIGAQNDYANPDLEPVTFAEQNDLPGSMSDAVDVGLKTRPDLISQRKSVSSQVQSLRGTEIDAGVTWTLDLSYNRQFSPAASSNRNTTFLLSYPLFDGGKSKAMVQEGRARVESAKARLGQAEKDARSEIEATYLTYHQNEQALESADLALKAARLNFDAAEGSQKAGASSLIDVITAQVSLVTAESNYIEATYDLLISQLKLRLVTGLPMPGEDV
ncbi:MAG: TolC family protein [Armatimonadetes bacterium]|nr:TolC family protein [Armatimonadota bacterium]